MGRHIRVSHSHRVWRETSVSMSHWVSPCVQTVVRVQHGVPSTIKASVPPSITSGAIRVSCRRSIRIAAHPCGSLRPIKTPISWPINGHEVPVSRPVPVSVSVKAVVARPCCRSPCGETPAGASTASVRSTLAGHVSTSHAPVHASPHPVPAHSAS